jgi:hypothetical protein
MNRFAILVALLTVVGAVSAMSASFTGTSFGVITVLVASGVLVCRFAQSIGVLEPVAAAAGDFRVFVIVAIRHLFRIAVGSLVIAWMVVSLLWFVIG